MEYLINRLKERSTWLGIISLATGVWLYINPACIEPIIAAGVGLAGLIGITTPDKSDDSK